MYPILFRIGSFEVTSFGVMVAAAGLVGLWLFRHELRRSGLPVDATDAGIAGVIAGHGRSAGRHSERRRGTAGGCDPHSHRLCRRPDSVRYGSISSVARIPRDGVSAGSAQLERETVGTHSLLYTWRGSESSLDAILLAGHLDVVPVEPGTETKWQQDPFSGRIADGFIWGRGAIDNKSAVIGILEAIEMLLGEGFRPARTLYLAYGHDEEVGGTGGAREIATVLKARGVALEMVLDEGGVIGDDLLAGISEPVALVGIAEKGFVSLELSARVAGGHSSLPPSQSAVGIVSAAVARLEQNPMAARLEGPTRQLFDRIGPHFPFVQRALLANLWLTRPFVVRSLEKSPATNAMVRTTTAPTIFQAGTKDNVLPSYARAVINFRILPGDTVATVVEHVSRVIDDDRVDIKTVGRFSAEPSATSSTHSESFRALERAIRSVAPDVVVAPYLVVVVTDARYYSDLSRNVFRFLPVRLTSRDLERMHGIDERIAIRDYEAAIRAYRQLVIDAAGSVGRQHVDMQRKSPADVPHPTLAKKVGR